MEMRDLGTFRGHKVSCEGQLKTGCEVLVGICQRLGERSDVLGLLVEGGGLPGGQASTG